MSFAVINPADSASGLAAIVLAAGRSSRMAPHDKLLRQRDGVPVLTQVVSAALDCVDDVRIVLRPQAESAREALEGLPVQLVENREADEGMASSIRAGLASLSAAHRGALIMLADMPGVMPDHLRQLIAAFDTAEGRRTVVPVFNGRRGNPVLWSAAYFPELLTLQGDTGARELLLRDAASLVRVEMPDDGVLVDIDTAEDWANWLSRSEQVQPAIA